MERINVLIVNGKKIYLYDAPASFEQDMYIHHLRVLDELFKAREGNRELGRKIAMAQLALIEGYLAKHFPDTEPVLPS